MEKQFMPELRLKQSGFTYSACGPFTKHRKRIWKFKETIDLNYIYENKWDKTCFALNAAYFSSKDLANRTISDNILNNRAYEVAINPQYDGYQRGLAVICNFSNKKTGSRGSVNKELPQELHKPNVC